MDTKKRVRLEDAIVEVETETAPAEKHVVEESVVVAGPDGERYLRKTTLTTYQIVAGERGTRVWDPLQRQVQQYLYVGEPEPDEGEKEGGA